MTLNYDIGHHCVELAPCGDRWMEDKASECISVLLDILDSSSRLYTENDSLFPSVQKDVNLIHVREPLITVDLCDVL
jgi:hypothetical protein